jgi:NADPH-dependent 2,4-dienoyl-CoA reductase/sulfur reductase-like enzyme
MDRRDFDVVVVGAGPAGLAAARRAAECGASVAMLDDNPSPGGQIWRASAGATAREAAGWMVQTPEVICGARVFAAPGPGRIAVETLDGEREVGYRSLVLATGARERFLPFPGWTLPNVMGAGGLQALAKSGLPVEGKRVVVAGSGPLLLAVAKYMRAHGAEVRLIAEQADQSALLRFGMQLAGHPGKLIQAARFRASLLGVRYLTSCWPVAAQGSGELESVTLRSGGKTWTEACDYLACGFGLIPNTELAALFGCKSGDSGVAVDEYQQTSVAGVYAAGEVTGIGGLELSLVEGEIAGFAAAGQADRARTKFGERQSHRHFAAALESAFTLRSELRELAQDGTLVCRCEDVTFSRVRACHGWREAKLHTRCGMGPCQGRVCGPAVEFLLGWKPESVRPPVFPVRVGSLGRTADGG